MKELKPSSIITNVSKSNLQNNRTESYGSVNQSDTSSKAEELYNAVCKFENKNDVLIDCFTQMIKSAFYESVLQILGQNFSINDNDHLKNTIKSIFDSIKIVLTRCVEKGVMKDHDKSFIINSIVYLYTTCNIMNIKSTKNLSFETIEDIYNTINSKMH